MRIIYDTATGNFTFDESTVRPFGANIEARLNRHGQTVHFDGLEYGVTITRNNGAPETHTFPPSGVVYRNTDQDVLTALTVRWRPEDAIKLNVWITNGGVTRTGQHNLTVPRPVQPYPSWTWDGIRWIAPVPYPLGSGFFDWDDSTQTWVAASF